MRALVRLGDQARSTRLIPVRSVHIPTWCSDGSPDAWAWLESMAGRVLLPVTANPGGPDDLLTLGRKRILEGLKPQSICSFSCAPHLSGNHPGKGHMVAWGGRAASAFANSVLGARSEEETFESAVASAITGLTVERRLHLDGGRRPTIAVLAPENVGADYALLGKVISGLVTDETPLICCPTPSYDEAKRFALAINAGGRVPLFMLSKAAPPGLEQVYIEDRAWQEALMDQAAPELLILGCPHLSEQDINRWARYMSGRKFGKAEVWFLTSRLCLDKCPLTGAVLATRGRVLVDRCPRAMMGEIDGRVVGCDSPALASCLLSNGVEARALSHEAIRKLI
jgi:predicted aconitase